MDSLASFLSLALRGARRLGGGAGSISPPPPPPPPPSPPSAVLVSIDQTTGGAWNGVYGSKGSFTTDKTGGTSNLPSGYTLGITGDGFAIFGSYTIPAAKPQLAGGGSTFLGVFFSATSMTLDIAQAVVANYDLRIYMADADNSRVNEQTIEVRTPGGTLLDGPRNLTTFDGGAYYHYAVTNEVLVILRYLSGVANCVFEVVLFD